MSPALTTRSALLLSLLTSSLSACVEAGDSSSDGPAAGAGGSVGGASAAGGSGGAGATGGTSAGGTSAGGTGETAGTGAGDVGGTGATAQGGTGAMPSGGAAGTGGASGLGGSSGGGAGGSSGTGGASGTAGASGAGGTDPGPRSDIVGKVSVGYQGWFTAPTDGSPINGWWHYTGNNQTTPAPGNILLKSWPDMSQIETGFATDFPNLGNGNPATLFSSYTFSTVDTHVGWMQENDIDTLALQRFGDWMEVRNVVAEHVRDAAEARGRKFYIMYDISGWTTFQADLPNDWSNVIVGQLHLTDSSAYAMEDGRPVVCIWGMGFNDRPGDSTSSLDVVNFFKNQGVYVMGGVAPDWRTSDGTRWSKTGYGAVYDALDAISPWMVGVIGDIAGSDGIRTERNEGDVAYCHERGIAYQPCVLPGDLQLRQRVHGDFMWHQFANMIEIGADGLYISMFDEFNEGNQIAKTAASSVDVPVGSTFLPLDEDGTACSPDYYLRLTGDGGRMLKGEIPFTWTRPTLPN